MKSIEPKQDQYSYQVIGLAMETHRELGPGLDEIFYHELLSRKIDLADIPFQFKPGRKLIHKGIVADEFEADLIVGLELILELKVLREHLGPKHLLQLICYLKHWEIPVGFLLDFGKESLVFRRIVYTCPVAHLYVPELIEKAPEWVTDRDLLVTVAESLARILDEYGLGYRDSTYRGLLRAELNSIGVPCVRKPLVPIHAPGKPLVPFRPAHRP